MRGHKIITISAILILGITIIYPVQAYVLKRTQDNSKKQETGLLQYLTRLGDAYDCFFTVEEAWKEGEAKNKIESETLQMPFKRNGLVPELEQLRQSLPLLIFEIDKENPRIIHIIDSRLMQQKGYGLDSVLKSIDFTGSVNELVTEISKQGVPISTPMLTDTHEIMFRDFTTTVQVRGAGLKVRDALSNFIQLNGRGRILWIARTKLGQGEASEILFRGPQNRRQ